METIITCVGTAEGKALGCDDGSAVGRPVGACGVMERGRENVLVDPSAGRAGRRAGGWVPSCKYAGLVTWEGCSVGPALGCSVGPAVGAELGSALGDAEGAIVGCIEGACVRGLSNAM